MCEAAVYLIRGDQEEMLLESIDLLECEGDQINMINIFGEHKKIRAKIKGLSLVDHKILLEPLE
ncbi:MAG: CooT family nickel-binding protein [Pseudomonadota bacterium]